MAEIHHFDHGWVSLTAVSAVSAIAAVGVGFAIALLGSGARRVRILTGGVIAGLGVAAMHYTGMAAISVHQHTAVGTPPGATGTSLLIPIGLGVIFAALGLVYAFMAAPNEDDRAGAAYLAARLADNEAADAAPDRPQRSGSLPQSGPRPTMNSSWTFRDRSER